MQIIIYVHPPSTLYHGVSVDIIPWNRGLKIEHEFHHTLDALAARLRQPYSPCFNSLLILCPANGL